MRCGFQLMTVYQFAPLAQDLASWRTEAFGLTASGEFGALSSGAGGAVLRTKQGL